MNKIKILGVLLLTLFTTQAQLSFDVKDIPDRWFFNTTGKRSIGASYSIHQYTVNNSYLGNTLVSDLFTTRTAYTLSYSTIYEWNDKKHEFRDDVILFHYFPAENIMINGEEAKLKSYAWNMQGMWDLIGWEFLDIKLGYAYGFGNHKIIIKNIDRYKISNPFFNLSLGGEFALTIPTKDKGITLRAYSYYNWDSGRAEWKDKHNYGFIPEPLKIKGLVYGATLEYTFKRYKKKK